LHRMHTTVRRLRTALQLFGHSLPTRALSALQYDLRWLGKVLSRARDGDVQTAMLEHGSAEEGGDDSLALYRAWVERERSKSQDAVRRALDTRRYLRLLVRLRRMERAALAGAAGKGPGAQPVARVGPRLIRNAWRKLIQRGRKSQRHAGDDAALHRVRICCKRLRYLCEFLGAGSGVAGSARLAVRVTAIQDCLGAQHDAVIAARWMQSFQHQAGPRADFLRAALRAGLLRHAGQQRAHCRRFERLWARFDRRRHAP